MAVPLKVLEPENRHAVYSPEGNPYVTRDLRTAMVVARLGLWGAAAQTGRKMRKATGP